MRYPHRGIAHMTKRTRDKLEDPINTHALSKGAINNLVQRRVDLMSVNTLGAVPAPKHGLRKQPVLNRLTNRKKNRSNRAKTVVAPVGKQVVDTTTTKPQTKMEKVKAWFKKNAKKLGAVLAVIAVGAVIMKFIKSKSKTKKKY